MQFITRYPLQIDTSKRPYIIPKYTIKRDKNDTLAFYAQKFLDEYARRGDGLPVYVELWAVGGNYKGPSWRRDHYLFNELDATPWDTPGIWPNHGINYWNGFIKQLQGLLTPSMNPVLWSFDNETHFSRWQSSLKINECFRNMVKDPRWKTEPLLGVGFPGQTFLDESEVQDTITRKDNQGNPITDSLKAIQMIEVLDNFVRNEAFRQMVAGISGRYCDWGGRSHTRALDWGISPPIEDRREVEHKWAWDRIAPWLSPSHPNIPGVAPFAVPVFYGPKNQASRDNMGMPLIAWCQQRLDAAMAFYPPSAIIAAISMPLMLQKNGIDLRWEDGEYEEILKMLEAAGIQEVMIFNQAKPQFTPDQNKDEYLFIKHAAKINNDFSFGVT